MSQQGVYIDDEATRRETGRMFTSTVRIGFIGPMGLLRPIVPLRRKPPGVDRIIAVNPEDAPWRGVRVAVGLGPEQRA